ncbi:hypothetical protein [Phormidesmis priestleyi]|uniref:hypothetical protein n=1 Tax=Phormidesmis priestleyi TaxID=268141 RepID=UPI000AE5C4F3|nr:hypothetical protein [Phormidesmis priestleyi]
MLPSNQRCTIQSFVGAVAQLLRVSDLQRSQTGTFTSDVQRFSNQVQNLVAIANPFLL